MKNIALLLTILCLCANITSAAEGKHLFILSGQSNMKMLDPKVSFTPAVEEAFGADSVIVKKVAQGGVPIRRWYKKWVPAPDRTVEDGNITKAYGDLYDRLMKQVRAAIKDQKLASVTFVWMQGERDAYELHGEVYAQSFRGLIEQLQEDLGRDDVNFVIGRLSDMDMTNTKYPHWTIVREQQVEVAESSERGVWVDTDDLSMKPDNLHYDKEGSKELGKRFAEAAIALIKKPQ
jgi:hypothetical protein